MSNNALGTNVIAQIAILVNDIDKTSEVYADVLGVDKPKWFWTEGYKETQTEYKGEPSDAKAKLAFFNMGNLQLELIEPDQQPSTWRDHLNEHGEGLHHIAFIIKGMKEKIAFFESKGMKLIQKGEYTGGRYAYLDTIPQMKILLELLENDN